MARRPTTLFARTAITIAIVMIVFELFAFLLTAYYVMIPVAKRSADDLAAFIVTAVEAWEALPPAARPALEYDLEARQGLVMHADMAPLEHVRVYLPYVYFLRNSLLHRLQTDIRFDRGRDQDGETWYWFDIPRPQATLRLGFPASRIDIHIPSALISILISSALLTGITTVLLVRRLTRPLARLASAAEQLGAGDMPGPVPETGPGELATLARTFNDMAAQIQQLLSNRTVLLAGIAHDLRTPIARIRLAVEMLDDGAGQTDTALIEQITADLEDMNRLIGESLAFSRGLHLDDGSELAVNDLLEKLVADMDPTGEWIRFEPADPPCRCHASTLVLRRIVQNLLCNALRYGGGKPIRVCCGPTPEGTLIRVIDQGPGIPAEELELVFQPFYRLDKSRNSRTGGSGLGLAIARQLADRHRWALDLHSTLGQGTEARLRIGTATPTTVSST